MAVLSLVIILSSILAIMAIDVPGGQIAANIQPRGYVAGILSMVVAGTPSPTTSLSVVTSLSTSTTVGKVGVPLHQTTTLSQTSMVSTGIDLSTNTPQLGTPKAVTLKPTFTSTYTHPLYYPPSFYTRHSLAVILVSVFGALLFLTLVGIIVWRALNRRNIPKKEIDVDEEDAIEAYAKYWKQKRDSGGIAVKEKPGSSPAV